MRHGLKTALACVLAYVITRFAGLPYGFWAVVTTVIVMQINVADSVRLCWFRFTGTALGAAIGVASILIFPETPFYTMLGLALITGFCAYMTRYNERYRMAAITVVIVFLAGVGEEGRVAFAIYRVLEIGIGIACAFAVSLLLWPVRAGETLSQRLSRQLERTTEVYVEVLEAFLDRQQKVDPKLLDELAREVTGNRALYLKVLKHERLFYHRNLEELSAQMLLLDKILDNLRNMENLLNHVDEEGHDIIMAEELRDLASATTGVLRSMANDVNVDSSLLCQTLDKVEERFKELRAEGVTKRFNLAKLLQVFGFINSLILLGQEVLRMVERE